MRALVIAMVVAACGDDDEPAPVAPEGHVECSEEDGPRLVCAAIDGERCCTGFEQESHCAATCGEREGGFACDGDEDCPAGTHCCASMQSTSICAFVCAGAGLARMCHQDEQCPSAHPCCEEARVDGVRLGFCGDRDAATCR